MKRLFDWIPAFAGMTDFAGMMSFAGMTECVRLNFAGGKSKGSARMTESKWISLKLLLQKWRYGSKTQGFSNQTGISQRVKRSFDWIPAPEGMTGIVNSCFLCLNCRKGGLKLEGQAEAGEMG